LKDDGLWISREPPTVWTNDRKDKDDAIVGLKEAIKHHPHSRYFGVEYSVTGDGAEAIFYDRLRARLKFGNRALQATSEHGMMMGPLEFYTYEKADDKDIKARAATIENNRPDNSH
jgi:hypothetical protein